MLELLYAERWVTNDLKILSYLYQTLPQREVIIETQKFTYDYNSFIADFGGFLGLLLGISFIDIYNFITGFIWRHLGNKK